MRVPAGLLVLTMGYALAIIMALATTCVPSAGGDVPFATPPALKPDSNNAYVPSLGEIMQLIQLKHIKLWHAGGAANWV